MFSTIKKCSSRTGVLYSYNNVIIDTVCFSKGDIEFDLGKLIRNDTCEAASRYISILNKTKVDTSAVVYKKQTKDTNI